MSKILGGKFVAQQIKSTVKEYIERNNAHNQEEKNDARL